MKVQARRICGIVVFLALTLVLTTSVSTAQTSNTRILSSILPAVSLEVQSVLTWEGMVPGNNVSTGVQVRVHANTGYVLRMHSDRTNMAEYNTMLQSFVPSGRVLANPLEWKLGTDITWSQVPTAPTQVYAAGATGNGGETVTVQFRQAVEYADVPFSVLDRKYAAIITYTVASAL